MADAASGASGGAPQAERALGHGAPVRLDGVCAVKPRIRVYPITVPDVGLISSVDVTIRCNEDVELMLARVYPPAGAVAAALHLPRDHPA